MEQSEELGLELTMEVGDPEVVREDTDTDGCSLHSIARHMVLADEDVDAFVLFADIEPTDTDAIEARQAEYAELFDGT